jgi:hypothetical protein
MDRTICPVMADKQDTDVLSVGSPETSHLLVKKWSAKACEDSSYFDYTKTCKSPDVNAEILDGICFHPFIN